MFDSEQSPQKKPVRCIRTIRAASASSSRLIVSGRRVCEKSARYGRENCRCRVISTDSSGSPSLGLPVGDDRHRLDRGEVDPLQGPEQVVLPLGDPLAGLLERVHVAAPSRTNRTMCREMPCGSATRCSAGHCSSGVDQGRSSSAGSTRAEVIRTGTSMTARPPHRLPSWLGPQRRTPRLRAGPVAWSRAANPQRYDVNAAATARPPGRLVVRRAAARRPGRR